MTQTSPKDTIKAKFISMIKQLSLTIRLSLVCCSLGHMVVNVVRLVASQFSKVNRQSFSDFKQYAAVKLI